MSNKDPIKQKEKPKRIAEVKPVQESRNMIVRTRDQLRELVEFPLLRACEELYDKNIRTLSTSANEQDIKYQNAHIIIDFGSLSEENKEIGKQLGEIHRADNLDQLVIKIPVEETSTIQ